MTITADNITDEQIRELQRRIHEPGLVPDGKFYQVKYACEIALQKEPMPTSAQRWRYDNARASCAEILNARAARAGEDPAIQKARVQKAREASYDGAVLVLAREVIMSADADANDHPSNVIGRDAHALRVLIEGRLADDVAHVVAELRLQKGGEK